MSLTVSLVAVLIPLLFMGDIVGRLFREFAVTLSVTILVSAVVSLTLTPMMCSRLLKHKPAAAQGRFYRASERFFDEVIRHYGTTLRWVSSPDYDFACGHRHAVCDDPALCDRPKGFFPVQDTGVIQGVSEAPQTVSFQAMADHQQALARVILPIRLCRVFHPSLE